MARYIGWIVGVVVFVVALTGVLLLLRAHKQVQIVAPPTTPVVVDHYTRTAETQSQVNKGVADVKAQPNAKDTAGAAGDTGLVALCRMRNYENHPDCTLLRNDPARVGAGD